MQGKIQIPLQVIIPSWARWLAQDGNGSWWVYSARPRFTSRQGLIWVPQRSSQYVRVTRIDDDNLMNDYSVSNASDQLYALTLPEDPKCCINYIDIDVWVPDTVRWVAQDADGAWWGYTASTAPYYDEVSEAWLISEGTSIQLTVEIRTILNKDPHAPSYSEVRPPAFEMLYEILTKE